MKLKSILICLIIIILVCYSCGCTRSEPTNELQPTIIKKYSTWSEIVIVDGCEYARFNDGDYDSYTHLGTCKQCWAKMEQLTGKRLHAERE